MAIYTFREYQVGSPKPLRVLPKKPGSHDGPRFCCESASHWHGLKMNFPRASILPDSFQENAQLYGVKEVVISARFDFAAPICVSLARFGRLTPDGIIIDFP